MSEENIINDSFEEKAKKFLCEYEADCMNLLDENVEETHAFSKKYQQRMKKIMWSQHLFGSKIRTGLYVRNIAAAILLLIVIGASSFGVVKAAEAFGLIDGWRFFNIEKGGSGSYKMDIKEEKSEENTTPQNIVKGEPSYLPKGFKEVTRKEHLPIYSSIEWYLNHKEVAVFSVTPMEEGMTFGAEYLPETIETIKVKGHEMTAYPTDNNGATILWTDSYAGELEDGQEITTDCLYQISYDLEHTTQKEIIKMIESMYE